jgi:hypothetical protein
MNTRTQLQKSATQGPRNRPALEPKSKVFSVRLQLEDASKIEDLATARGVTPSRLLALMLDDYLNQQARIHLQETLVQIENRAGRRDAELEWALKKVDSRLAGLEKLLQESLRIE